MMTLTRTYSPVEISVRYTRYAETCSFTGHEHYADLKIINMKAPSKREQKQACLIFVEREVLRDEVSTYGRLYDPVIARFFSPDNFVQAPEFTQSYNRYSYCLNNPLQYTDPSGEELFAPWYRDFESSYLIGQHGQVLRDITVILRRTNETWRMAEASCSQVTKSAFAVSY